MNQPKFKFGDRVFETELYSKLFIINAIHFNGRYYYGDSTNHHGIPEEDLELYQEPKKKKLFAMMSGIAIMFYSEIPKNGCVGLFERAPEYDIIYPEDKNESSL